MQGPVFWEEIDLTRILTLLFLIFAVPAHAQNWDCSDPGNLPQQGMNYCAHQDWKTADAELNRVYKDARAAM